MDAALEMSELLLLQADSLEQAVLLKDVSCDHVGLGVGKRMNSRLELLALALALDVARQYWGFGDDEDPREPTTVSD